MMSTVKDLFSSKKFLVAIIAVAAGVAARFGFALDQSAVLEIVTPLWAYVVAQGIADHGKEMAIVNGQIDRDLRADKAAIISGEIVVPKDGAS